MRQLLFIDTETGGLDPSRYSIISLGAVVWRDGQRESQFHVFINEPEICHEPEAMAVHKVSVEWLREHGESPAAAVRLFEDFLGNNFSLSESRPTVTLAGHNVSFDIGFLRRLYGFANVDYDTRFLHRRVDTSSILTFLIHGNLVELESSKSDDAFEYFGINFKPNSRHTALGDAVATAELYTRMLNAVEPCPPCPPWRRGLGH